MPPFLTIRVLVTPEQYQNTRKDLVQRFGQMPISQSNVMEQLQPPVFADLGLEGVCLNEAVSVVAAIGAVAVVAAASWVSSSATLVERSGYAGGAVRRAVTAASSSATRSRRSG